MSHKSDEGSLWKYGLIQGFLLAVAIAVYWWYRNRNRSAQHQPDQQKPVVWRRDIEMGPPEGAVDELVEEEVVIEAIPQVRAGDGGLSDEGTQEPEDEAAVVTGPVPDAETLPEDATPGGDDLELIEGIGPKINTILQAAGIRTFAQLAGADVARLEEILHEAGMRRINNPATWPEQARFAAEANWSGLENFQKELRAGRRMF